MAEVSSVGSPSRYARCKGPLGALLAALAFIAIETPLARADVIWLKDGRQIVVHITHMDGRTVYYERDGRETSVPLSAVDHIDNYEPPPDGQNAAPEAGTANSRRPPAVQMPAPPPNPAIHDDAVDEVYLQQLDRQALERPSAESRRRLSRAYQAVAFFLANRGDPESAIEKCRHALDVIPGDFNLTLSLGYLFFSQNRYAEAVELLEPATQQNPRSLEAHLLLGYSYYFSENLDGAVAEWKKALAIRDDPRVRQLLAGIENESEATGSYQGTESGHFMLRFEGGKGGALGGEVLRELETDFQDLEAELNVSPTEKIVVWLYPNETFRDITRSPSWAGAINNGKIRVPVSGLTSVTPQLARVLKHELTHSFIRQATLGRCPAWFNEGLAQLEDGSSTARYGKQLAKTFPEVPPYSMFEGSFVNLPTAGAALAYAKSLAALEYLRDTYGMNQIRELLRAMAAQPDFDSVLQLQLHLTYATFDKEVGAYLQRRYAQ